MKILTSGRKYIDIDGFACLYAYKELLDLLGIENKVIMTGVLNASVTKKYLDLKFYEKNIDFLDNETKVNHIIMDLSDPNQFENFVDIEKVEKIFDHHPGFETYWKEKIGENAIIKPIGAAATLIYEEFKNNNLLEKISKKSAELLAVAILSNTLNFQSNISKQIDKDSYEELKKYFDYTPDFESNYFSDVQSNIEENILNSLVNDSKIILINNKSFFISQSELWSTDKLFKNYFNDIKTFLDKQKEDICFLNLIDISKNYNLIIFKNIESLNFFKKYFPEFSYDENNLISKTENVILRKEILTRFYNN